MPPIRIQGFHSNFGQSLANRKSKGGEGQTGHGPLRSSDFSLFTGKFPDRRLVHDGNFPQRATLIQLSNQKVAPGTKKVAHPVRETPTRGRILSPRRSFETCVLVGELYQLWNTP